MQKQTQSSKLIGISFPNELAEKLLAKAHSTGKAFPWVVRYACLQMLASNGVDVSNIPNPEGRGVRSDLKKRLTPQQERERLRYLIEKKRKGEGNE